MADEADKTPEDTDDELLLTDKVEGQDEQVDETAETVENDEQDDDLEVPTFGEDLAEEKADDSSLIKHLRAELKRTREQLRETPRPVEETIEVGEKPKLADFDYDEDKYEAALDEWKERDAAARSAKAKAEEGQKKQAEAWTNELKRYADGKAGLGYADVEDAEQTVVSTLSEVQQAVMVKVAQNPAKLMYALAKNPDRLTQLAGQSDPLKFAGDIARLEGQLKMTKRRKAPDPEEIERGSGSATGSGDRRLAELKRKADASGDYTAYFEAKRQLAKK